MKLRMILNEIGDSAKVYNYDKSSIPKIKDISDPYQEYYIYFKTDKNTKYQVAFYTALDDDKRFGIIVYFKTVSGNKKDDVYSFQTNKYEVFSVMATISDIVLKTLKKNNGKIKFIQFSPSKTENDKSSTPIDQTQRAKLYLAYIKSKLTSAGIGYSHSVKGHDVFINILGTK